MMQKNSPLNDMKRAKKIISVLLLLAAVSSFSLTSCKKQMDGPSGSAPIETQIPQDTGADLSKVEPVPDVPNTENSMIIKGEELLSLIRTGAIAENGDYAITDGSYLVFERDDNGKTYDLKNAIIRIGVREGEAGISLGSVRNLTLKNARVSAYGSCAIDTSKARTATLSKIHVTGNVNTAFVIGGKDIKLDGCTAEPAKDGKIENAVLCSGSNITVVNCNIRNVAVGVLDQSENGTVIENNLFTDCSTAVLCDTANSTVWYNTVKGGEVGIKAVDAKSEISAGQAKVYNILAAKNDVSNCGTSIVYEKVSNSVILLNTLENVTVSGCTNVYVNENALSGALKLNSNDYMIANGNIYGSIVVQENSNVNGDNVTDLTKRLSVGTNEALLPHINKEQFVGMKRKTEVRVADSSRDLKTYLAEEMQRADTVIVPPGAYTNLAMVTNNYSNTTVYAYGVLSETAYSRGSIDAWEINSSSNITVKGMFFGTSVYSHTQGTITEVGKDINNKNVLRFIADPGYHEDFTASSGNFISNTPGHLIKAGQSTSLVDISSYASNSFNSSTKVNTLIEPSKQVFNNAASGDRIVFRNGGESRCLDMHSCTEMKFEDVTVTSAAGFAERDGESDIAPIMHRFAVTAGPAPVLDSGKKYSDPGNVIWTDSYGRKRSAIPLYSTCDATHCTNSRVGIQVISCLLENMNDDGGNVNAHYSLLTSYNTSTRTIVYGMTDVRDMRRFGRDFRAGDTMLLYTMNGKYVGTAKATSATVTLSDEARSVVIDTDVVIPSGEQIVIQNASATGAGFLFDNVIVRNSHANGVRPKTPSGEIRNCTFSNIRGSGVKCTPEYTYWPECGYQTNLKIKNNIFDGLGRTDNLWDDWNNRAGCAPLVIRLNETDSTAQSLSGNINPPSSYSSDMAYCMHKNIEVSGNVFRNRYCRYEISISGVTELKITNNSFQAPNSWAKLSTNKSAILILTCNGVQINQNTYNSGISSPIENRGGIGVGIQSDAAITTVRPVVKSGE